MINTLVHILTFHELPSTTRREMLLLADEFDVLGQRAMASVLREAYAEGMRFGRSQRTAARRLAR